MVILKCPTCGSKNVTILDASDQFCDEEFRCLDCLEDFSLIGAEFEEVEGCLTD